MMEEHGVHWVLERIADLEGDELVPLTAAFITYTLQRC